MTARQPVSALESHGKLTVVCDDGTVWQLESDKAKWISLPTIPGTGHFEAKGATD